MEWIIWLKILILNLLQCIIKQNKIILTELKHFLTNNLWIIIIISKMKKNGNIILFKVKLKQKVKINKWKNHLV
jgi:hypothetical protein